MIISALTFDLMDVTRWSFVKMAGGGNDFIMLDGRNQTFSDLRDLAARACMRGLGIGADGLIVLNTGSETADVRMIYFNSDGSRADFCANGTRCAARFAVLEGLAGREMTIEADCGVVSATLLDDDRVILEVAGPEAPRLDRQLDLGEDGFATGVTMILGVPHFVEFVDGIWDIDVAGRGRSIRQHPELAPDGANANFVQVHGRDRIDIRTFERGVEGETLSCGSGVIAGVAASALTGRVDSPLTVRTRSGIDYEAAFEIGSGGISKLTLIGDARVVYEGTMTRETIAGFDPDWVRHPGPRDPEVS